MTRASSAQVGGRPRIGLLLAAIFAAVAGVLVFVAINSRGGDDTAPTATGQLVEVTRATTDIPARTEITASMVETVFVPLDTRLPAAFAESSEVTGRIATVTIFEGEQFIPSKAATLTELAANSLSYVVPAGLRAMAVNVDRVVSPGGLLRPGDRVDVIVVGEVTYRDPASDEEVTEFRAITIAQNIEVLAIDESLQVPAVDDENTPTDQPAADTEATVATLALPPQVAQDVLLADARGTLRLSVRAAGDNEVVTLEDSAFFSRE